MDLRNKSKHCTTKKLFFQPKIDEYQELAKISAVNFKKMKKSISFVLCALFFVLCPPVSAHHEWGSYASTEMPDINAIIDQAMSDADKAMEKGMKPIHFSDDGMEIKTEEGMVKYGKSGVEVANEKGNVKYGKDGMHVSEGDESISWDANGLNVKSKDGNVKYDKDGIEVNSSDEAVKIDGSGVHVKDGDKELHVPMDGGFMNGFFQNFFSFSWFPFWGN